MGYRGYSQNFCETGHFFESDEDPWDDPPSCPCGASIAISNKVHDTNCDAVNVIPPDVLKTLLVIPEKSETCNLGHEHVTGTAVYRIPSKEELRLLQHYWDGKEYRSFNRSHQ